MRGVRVKAGATGDVAAGEGPEIRRGQGRTGEGQKRGKTGNRAPSAREEPGRTFPVTGPCRPENITKFENRAW